MRVQVVRLFLIGLVLCLPMSCQKQEDEPHSRYPEKKENWLYVNFSVEPPTFDFRKTSCRTTSVLSEMIYEGLMKMDRDGSIQPAQAERVEISPDGMRYTFYLGDTYWSDGVPVTANDFVSSWLHNLDPKFPSVYTHLFYCIKNAQAAKEGRCPLSEVGIRVEGDKTIIVELEQPTAYFLCLTTSAWYFPIRLPKEFAKGHPLEGELVSNGPFMVQKWQPADHILIVKNPRYRCAADILLHGIEISLINDENTAAVLFENGEFDLLGMPFSPIPIELARTLAEKNKITSIPVGGVTVCCFNVTRAPFHHAKLRRAFSMAIDRRQLMDVFYPSAYAPAFTLVPSVFLLNGLKPAAPPTRHEEIVRARQDFEESLEELGLTRDDLPVIALAYNQNKGNALIQKLAEVMQQDWRDVLGVNVELRGLEVQSVIKKMVSKEYDAALITWTANYQDPMSFLDKFISVSHKNYPGWINAEYNDVIGKANASLDIKKRAEFLLLAEQIFQREAPCAPLFHWGFPMVMHSRVQGLYISPAASIDFTMLKVVPHAKKERANILDSYHRTNARQGK